MTRALPIILLPALLAAIICAQQSSADAAKKAKAEEKAKKEAKQGQKSQKATLKSLEPPQPVLAWIYPAGGRRGSTVEVTLSGNGIEPDRVIVSGGGVAASILDRGDGKTARVALAIDAGAETGIRELRVLNTGGVSNRFRFSIDDLPELTEMEPNSDKSAPQQIPSLPVIINGQILEGDRDYFRFHAAAGETVVCEIQARELLPFIADAVPGWFDPVLVLYAPDGNRLAFADDFRFHPDPLLSFRAPVDGDYTLELRDVIYRGRGDFVYRLKLGSPDTTHPDVAPLHLPPTDAPVAILGRIARPGDSAYHQFHAAKGERLILEVQARRFGSPLDSILTLLNERGQVLAENDDWSDPLSSATTHQADSRIVYTFSSAGEYTLRVRDVQGKGGDDYCYRVLITAPHPDFALRITPDNPRLGQGDTAAIAVNAVRRDEFAGEISLTVEGLPPGFHASNSVIPAGQNEGRLTITSPPDAALAVLSPSIVGVAAVGRHAAQPAEAMMQAFAYTHYLPADRLYLAVIPASAFTISTDAQSLVLKPGDESSIGVKVHRLPGVQAAVTILPQRLANGLILTKVAQVPPDKDEVTVTLSVDRQVKSGTRQDLIFSAVMRAGALTVTRHAPAIVLRVVQ